CRAPAPAPAASTRASRRLPRRRLAHVARRRRRRGCPSARARARRPRGGVNNEELARALVEHGYLEGDFVLRSGRRASFYLDNSRLMPRPDVLEPLGRRLAEAVQEHEADAVRLACPVLGAVVL